MILMYGSIYERPDYYNHDLTLHPYCSESKVACRSKMKIPESRVSVQPESRVCFRIKIPESRVCFLDATVTSTLIHTCSGRIDPPRI
jgi:hypothetical protein